MKLTMRSARSAGLGGHAGSGCALSPPARLLLLQLRGRRTRAPGSPPDAPSAARGRRPRSRPGWCRSAPLRRRARRCWRAEAAEHQQVVPRGRSSGSTRQLRVQQVGDVQVDELPAGPALQRGLERGDAALELGPRDADPEVADAAASGSAVAVRRTGSPRHVKRQRIDLRHRVSSSLAASRAKYVSTPSAPARLNASSAFQHHQCRARASRFARRLFSIAYSPLTWYAKVGHAELVLHAAHDVEVRHAGA